MAVVLIWNSSVSGFLGSPLMLLKVKRNGILMYFTKKSFVI